MKYLSAILLVISLIGCRQQQKKSQHSGSAPARTKVERTASPSSTSSTLPPDLLKTPRITVSANGAIGHPILGSPEQADAILTDIRTLPPSAIRDRALSGVLGSLAEIDPELARTRLEDWKGGLISEWLDAAKSVAKHLAKKDPEAAASFIEESVPPASRADVWGSFLVDLPPVSRLPFFDRIPEGFEKFHIAADMIASWLPEDPQACAQWIDGFTAGWDPEEVNYLRNPLRVAIPPETGVAPWLAAFRSAQGKEPRRFLAEEAWSRADAPGRAELMAELQDSMPDLEDREWESILISNAGGYANALSSEQITALSPADVRKLISYWSGKHPDAAIHWAMEHERSEAAGALVRLYLLEPQSAFAIAPKLPPGKDRDDAVSHLCQLVAHHGSVEAAKALLPLISDPQRRELARRNAERDRE